MRVNRLHLRRLLFATLLATLLLPGLALAGLYAYAGWYGINTLVRRGGALWDTVKPDSARLPSWMRLALEQSPAAQPGPIAWTTVVPGFEVAELAALVGGDEVDRILLARVEPARFRVEVHNAPAGDRELGDWMSALGAALVINGSYYGRDGKPDTPFLSAGTLSGPREYDARHGALVASRTFTGIRDLEHLDWRSAFAGADYAMVSYPLLVGPAASRVKADPRWLANRSFVGEDDAGHLIFGTTRNAFFSLERLAQFLRQAPLGLTLALNLDGGPVACQGIALGAFKRDFCGEWELATSGNDLRLLRPVFGNRRWALPIVLAVAPR